MKSEHYKSYAPDKHGPAAEKRKSEAAEFVEALRIKHGIPLEILYPAYPERNKYVSYARR